MIAASGFREEEAATPDFSVNVSNSFPDVPFMERFDEAARLGFKAVDLTFPSAIPSQILARRLRDTQLTLVAFSLPSGASDDATGLACDPKRVSKFRDAVRRAIDYAAQLGCLLLNCSPGEPPPQVSPLVARKVLIENLQYAAEQSMHASIRILLEAV